MIDDNNKSPVLIQFSNGKVGRKIVPCKTYKFPTGYIRGYIRSGSRDTEYNGLVIPHTGNMCGYIDPNSQPITVSRTAFHATFHAEVVPDPHHEGRVMYVTKLMPSEQPYYNSKYIAFGNPLALSRFLWFNCEGDQYNTWSSSDGRTLNDIIYRPKYGKIYYAVTKSFNSSLFTSGNDTIRIKVNMFINGPYAFITKNGKFIFDLTPYLKYKDSNRVSLGTFIEEKRFRG